jgi:hypothetical protein
MPNEFKYDVFLRHRAKDKAVVRPLAERLRKEGRSPNAKGRRLNDKVELQPQVKSGLRHGSAFHHANPVQTCDCPDGQNPHHDAVAFKTLKDNA